MLGVDRLLIPHSAVVDGVLRGRIAEEKDEVSHLDQLVLEIDGRPVAPRPLPGLATMSAIDRDAFELVYDLPNVKPTSKIELVSSGYYDIVGK